MKLAIMQPYFLPYIGYWQLIAAVDHFVIYDNIKYTKKGWINRNRFLLNGRAELFSLPLKRDSDYLNVVQREMSADFDRQKMINQFAGAYRRAPCFNAVMPLVERIVRYPEQNLFEYIHHSIQKVCEYLHITTPITVSSSISIDHSLGAQDKVLAICGAMGATTYINPAGGKSLYSLDDFSRQGVNLIFQQASLQQYRQFACSFVPALSILDVLMFNDKDKVIRFCSII